MSPDTVFGNFPSVTLNIYPTPTEPCYKSINNKAPQKSTQHTCGHPLDTAILMEEPLIVAAAMQPSRVAVIHHTMV